MNEASKTKQQLIGEINRLKEEVSQLKGLARENEFCRRELMEYRDLLEMVPEIIFRINPDGRFTYVNESVRALGYDPEELLGHHFDAIIHPDDVMSISREKVLPSLRGKTLAPEECPRLFDERRTGPRKTRGLEIRLVRKGSACSINPRDKKDLDTYARVSSCGKYDRDVTVQEKQFLGTIGIIRNIHPQESSKDESLTNENLAKVIPDVVYRLDSRGRFTFVNDAVKNLGYKPEELLGKHFTAIIPEEYVELVSREKVLPKLKGQNTGVELAPKLFDERRTGPRRTTKLEIPIITKFSKKRTGQLISGDSNSILGEVTASGYYDSNQPTGSKEFLGTVGIIRDITNRHQAEQDLLKKNRELDDFAYMVSHDLKSPLKLIQGFLVLIQQKPALFDKYFSRVMNQSGKMINLVDSLLRLSRAGRALENKEEVNLGVLLKRVFVCIKPDKIKGKLKLIEPFPEIKADPARLEEIFTNLVENSFKYRNPENEQLLITFSGHVEEDRTIFSYTDNGLGIESKHLENVFKPGFVLDRDKGTGFGLAIIRKIVQAYGGKIWADSKGLGQGVTFYLQFPL